MSRDGPRALFLPELAKHHHAQKAFVSADFVAPLRKFESIRDLTCTFVVFRTLLDK